MVDEDFLRSLMRRGLISPAAAEQMTHKAEDRPAPYMHPNVPPATAAVAGFARGGLQGAGAPMPDWMQSNPVQRALQDPDNQIALEAFSPLQAARVSELVQKGYSAQSIADELGVGRTSVQRHLASTGERTAASENPSFWDDPANVEGLKQGIGRGLSHSAIAANLGTTKGNISSKIDRLRAAGELPDYVERDPSFWHESNAPKRERLKQLVREGYSQRQMARDEQLGASSPGQVAGWIKQMQARHGGLQDYAPQYSLSTKHLAPASQPGLPQNKFMQAPAPESDPEMERSIIDYLRARGLHAEADQLQPAA